MTVKSQKGPGPLADRQHEKFAQGLADMLSQEDAYKAAGYVPDRGNAARLAGRPEVKARVRELSDEALAFADVRRTRLVVDLDRIARADIGCFFERVKIDGKWMTQPKPFHKLTKRETMTLAVYKFDPKTGETEIKLKDSLKALETLLKYAGGLPEPAPSLNLNIFDSLSADDQRALADELESIRQRRQEEEAAGLTH